MENVQKDMEWLEEVIDQRFNFTFKKTYLNPPAYEEEVSYQDIDSIALPELSKQNSPYAAFIESERLDFHDRLLHIMSLIVHIIPDFYEKKLIQRPEIQNSMYEVGGIQGGNFRGFIPTGLTYFFVLCGYDSQKRAQAIHQLFQKSPIVEKKIVSFLPASPSEPILSGAMVLQEGHLLHLLG